MNLLLIGYRGSGKTTVGKILADRLHLPFIDTDVVITQRFNMTIADIWKTHGEPAFRKTESEVIAELLRHDNQVIALGGGAVMQPEARKSIESAADTVCIYLRATPQQLHHRIHSDSATHKDRPALTPFGGNLEEIRTILSTRAPTYESLANHILDVDVLSPQAAADQILSSLSPS